MVLLVAGLVAGLVVLAVAADQFVLGAARLAAQLQLSAVLIGALIIGFGTSAPEMVVSGIASSQGYLDVAVGNIVGSNVANLTLVLGSAALAIPIGVRSLTLRREAPLSFGATLLFALLVQGGLSRLDGLVLIVALLVALAWIIGTMRRGDAEISAEITDYLQGDEHRSMSGEVTRTLLGLTGTVGAAQLLVVSATGIADRLGLAEGFVGLTIVALGTSLPELATSLQAARKGESDLIVGNLLGSNLFNSLAVSSVAAMAGPGLLGDPTLAGLGVVLMVTVSSVATAFMATGRSVVRWEGALLLTAYVTALPLLR